MSPNTVIMARMRPATFIVLAGVFVALVIGALVAASPDGSGDAGQEEAARPAVQPTGPVSSTAAPTAEPDEGDLAVIDAVVLEWREWGPDAGSWNADLFRGGMENPPQPLHLDYGYRPNVSPNGRFTAARSRPSGQVAIFDLVEWKEVLSVPTAPQGGAELWSEDSSQVYGWREYCTQPANLGICLGEWQRDLWRVDLERGISERIFVFDFSLMGLQIEPQRDATRAYALGINTDICCAIDPEGDPFLAVLDLELGEVVRKIPLAGLLAGQLDYGLEDGSGASFYPELLLAPDSSRLYIVDAAEDTVLTVDLQSFAVERHELHEKRSALSRFGGWLLSQFVGSAEAKGGPSFHRRAALTPDGRYLLVSGTSSQEVERKDGSTERENRPSGLLIVDTESMTIELREKEAAAFRLSPDGRWLLAYGSYYDADLAGEDGHGGTVAFGLKVFDLTSLELAYELWPGEIVQPDAFSLNGRHAYVTSEGPGMAAARESDVHCNHDCYRLNLLDLASGEVIWRGRLAEQQSLLAFPPER